MEPCLPAIHSCCRSTAWSHLTPSICGFNAKRSGNKSEYFGIYLAKLLVLSDTPGMWKIQQKQWNIRNKNPRNGRLPNIYIYIYNLEQCHARVSKYSILSVFIFFEPYQSSKNKIKQLKNNEQQWKIMKEWKPMKKNMKKTTKTKKHTEKNPRNGRLPNI